MPWSRTSHGFGGVRPHPLWGWLASLFVFCGVADWFLAPGHGLRPTTKYWPPGGQRRRNFGRVGATSSDFEPFWPDWQTRHRPGLGTVSCSACFLKAWQALRRTPPPRPPPPMGVCRDSGLCRPDVDPPPPTAGSWLGPQLAPPRKISTPVRSGDSAPPASQQFFKAGLSNNVSKLAER